MSIYPPLKQLPHHIAIIMDGNGRWATRRHLPRMLGHQEGLKVVHRVVKACAELGIGILTLFAFSSENWRRSQQEVSSLLGLFLRTLKDEISRLVEHNVQLRIIGNCEHFSSELKQWIQTAQQLTAHNTGLVLVIAADYGGRWDIIQAIQKIAIQVMQGQLAIEAITADVFESYLQSAGLPAPDLCIRTSGEYRLSNFLLWQLAYSELYFTDVLWPNFDEQELAKALVFYANRERRFGSARESSTQWARQC